MARPKINKRTSTHKRTQSSRKKQKFRHGIKLNSFHPFGVRLDKVHKAAKRKGIKLVGGARDCKACGFSQDFALAFEIERLVDVNRYRKKDALTLKQILSKAQQNVARVYNK
jgi:hypothetical protein